MVGEGVDVGPVDCAGVRREIVVRVGLLALEQRVEVIKSCLVAIRSEQACVVLALSLESDLRQELL